MKKKNIIIIVITVFLVVAIYFSYKGFKLHCFNINNDIAEYQEFIKGIQISNTLTIKTDKQAEDYLEFNDIKIKNEFSNFEKKEEQNEFVKYVLYDENGVVKASMWLGVTETYVDLFKQENVVFGIDDGKIQDVSKVKLLEKRKIKNDIDLFKYLEQDKGKSTIFTSVSNMKDYYTLQSFMAIVLPNMNNITLINGDYDGYILNLKGDYKEVNILKNGKRYVLTFIGLEYFNDNYINELINSIVIG